MKQFYVCLFFLFCLLITEHLLTSSIADQKLLRRNQNEKNAELRTALIIGNNKYKSSPLKNPINDANDMKKVLTSNGFNVMFLTNANKRQMEKSIKTFGKKLQKGGIGLFFYAGHGMQVNGINYLIPIGSNIFEEDEVKYEAVDTNLILTKMESASNRLNMIFLDACRNNPFARSFRSSEKGLAVMDAPSGTLVAFATAPGKTAADGSSRNGLFTKYLIKYIQTPGLELSQVMKLVRKKVIQKSEKKQIPWDVSSLTGDFYFSGGRGIQVVNKKNKSANKNKYYSKLLANIIETTFGYCEVKDQNLSRIISVGARAIFDGVFLICPDNHYSKKVWDWSIPHYERKKKIHNYLVSLSDEDIIGLVKYVKSIKWLPINHIKKELIRVKKELESPHYIGNLIQSWNGPLYKIKRDEYGRILYPDSSDMYQYFEGQNASPIQKLFFRQGPIFKKKFLLAADTFLNSVETVHLSYPEIYPKDIENALITEKSQKGIKIIDIKPNLYQLFTYSTNWRNSLKPNYNLDFVTNVNGFSKVAFSEWLSELTKTKYYYEYKYCTEIFYSQGDY